ANYVRLPDVEELLARCDGHPGGPRLAAIVAVSDGPTRSQFEDAFLTLTRRFGLPRPKMNAIVAGREVDALFEDEKLIVELDGYKYHSSRSSFDDDRDRDADNLQAGYPTVRVTWD